MIYLRVTIFVFVLLTIGQQSFSQSFEGEIILTSTYKSKIQALSADHLGSVLGTRQEYFVQGAHYRSVMNGTIITMQEYDPASNRIYNKKPASDTLYWEDAALNDDSILSFEMKKSDEKILGYTCDILILHTKKSTQTFYYSKRLPVNGRQYKNHQFGNYAFYTDKTGSLPLKFIYETAPFTIESVAIEIKPMKFEKGYFDIDGKVPVKKSK